MVATSAGLCMWRWYEAELQILIVHPGGPYWAKKDDGAWSLPKGEYDPATEEGSDAARREFHEETGTEVATGELLALGETTLKSGKRIRAWAVQGDLDADTIISNTFELQWPPRSGHMQSFPEVDRAMWCNAATAAVKLNQAQTVFVDRLTALVGKTRHSGP